MCMYGWEKVIHNSSSVCLLLSNSNELAKTEKNLSQIFYFCWAGGILGVKHADKILNCETLIMEIFVHV